ncbi:MAG: alpha/beta fold hydrolase [Salibacteraceae bacterium]
MKLHYKIFGEGEPLIILHGLFGMLDNWQTLGKKWADTYQVILVDLRNHGHSPWDEDHTYQLMMEDLEELADDLFLDEINIIGHSMGGKLAMKFAQKFPTLMNKLIIADIGPKKYPVHHHQILEGLNSVPINTVKSRQEVKSYLSRYIPEDSTQQFFLKNLYWKEKGVLDWRFNLKGLTNNIQFVGEDLLGHPYNKPALFIRGGNSNYIQDSDWTEIKNTFSHAELATIPEAGHWLHAENPSLFFELVNDFLTEN